MSRISALYDAYLRKAPRQSRSRSVVEAILGAAVEKLSRTGDEADITLQDVATRAGVGTGSLYDYFRDRRSLLAALAAKVAEDNLRKVEEVLASAQDLPLEEAVGRLVDFCFETYLSNRRIPRALMRLAHSLDLVPLHVQNQNVFAEALAAALRKRTDVTAPDIDLAAWTAVQSMMGLVGVMVWEDEDRHARAALRAELVRMYARQLGG